jgi:hypothetical protein
MAGNDACRGNSTVTFNDNFHVHRALNCRLRCEVGIANRFDVSDYGLTRDRVIDREYKQKNTSYNSSHFTTALVNKPIRTSSLAITQAQ